MSWENDLIWSPDTWEDVTMPKVVLGVDPGDTTGVAIVSRKGMMLGGFNLPYAEMPSFLHRVSETFRQDILSVVAENYVLYGHKAQQQQGSTFKAVRVIGQLEMWTYMQGLDLELQMANILPIAMKWSKFRPKGAHSENHYVDAYNHAFYWLVRRGLTQPRIKK